VNVQDPHWKPAQPALARAPNRQAPHHCGQPAQEPARCVAPPAPLRQLHPEWPLVPLASTGQVNCQRCGDCGGRGCSRCATKLADHDSSAVDSAHRLRVSSEGNAGPAGGPSWRLLRLPVRVQATNKLHREGIHIPLRRWRLKLVSSHPRRQDRSGHRGSALKPWRFPAGSHGPVLTLFQTARGAAARAPVARGAITDRRSRCNFHQGSASHETGALLRTLADTTLATRGIPTRAALIRRTCFG